MRPATASAARSVGVLALLTVTLPVDLAVTLVALARGPRSRPERPQRRRTVLISGGKMTKALALCRAFHAAGHRVVLVETHKYRFTGHRFSRAVDAFHVVPAPTDDGYAEALLEVVRRERVDLYVPVCSPLASRYDARAARLLREHCDVLHAEEEQVALLDDKYRFARAARAADLEVPATYRVTSPAQVGEFDFPDAETPFVLKHLAYDPVNRLDLTRLPRPAPGATQAFAQSKTITPDDPWILQSFVAGQEYCTHSTVRDGRVLVWACCESSAFQVNYAMSEHPGIRAWVEHFVGTAGLTGQVSFDFIVDDGGRVLAIECNPRTHSAITMFYDQPAELARAYLGQRDRALEPTPASRPTYWIYHELWRALTDPRHARRRLRVIASGKDAIYDRDDPLPYLLVHHLQIPYLLLLNLRRRGVWTRIDFNIGKLVEPGGD